MYAPPTVTLPQGTLRGRTVPTVSGAAHFLSFQGVPYAKPPLGLLRFKPPQPPDSWEGILDATAERSVPPQIDPFKNEYVGDEDCLYLNIYCPKTSDDKLFPVMVWIHGGGFTVGSGNSYFYRPDYFIEHGVIVVTLNYRLGALGFMSTGDCVISGNMGLKDQLAALTWVHKNILHFGGDKNNVTLFGESAGSISTHFLVLSPKSKGLFHRAICQSGMALCHGILFAKIVKRTFKLCEALGFSTSDSKELLDFMRNVPAKTLVEKLLDCLTQEEKDLAVAYPFMPCLEHEDAEDAIITKYPMEVLKSKVYNPVSLMIGVTSNEGLMYVQDIMEKPSLLSYFNTEFQDMLPADLPVTDQEEKKKIAEQVKKFYLGNEILTQESLQKYIDIKSDVVFIHPAITAAKIHSSQNPSIPVFLYQFDVDGKLNCYKRFIAADRLPGACHADELGYMWYIASIGVKVLPDTLEDKTIKRITRMWTNFAKTGNPTYADAEIEWPPFTEENCCYLYIGSDLGIQSDMYKERVQFWDTLYKYVDE